MTTINKAILINAKEGTIKQVEVGVYTDIYKHCGFDLFTTIALGNGETLYVDDEGLINGTEYGFTIEGYENPIMGNGLILGSTAGGDSKDTAFTCEAIKAKVRCLRPSAFGFVAIKPTLG